jgi:hypothetical protein
VLNRGIFARSGQNSRQPTPAGNPVLELSHRVEPVASAASVSAGRRARFDPPPWPSPGLYYRARDKRGPGGGRERREGSAPPRALRGYWLDNAPFGAPLSFICRRRVEKSRFVRETGSTAPLRGLVVSKTRARMTRREDEIALFLSPRAGRGRFASQRVRPEVAGPMTSSAKQIG